MSKTKSPWPLRWDLLLRYRLIEIIAQWEGRLTTNHLCNSLGIGRQQASKDINSYLRDVAPGNLVYDRHLKGYKPTPEFHPRLTTGNADEYLHILGRNKDISHTFDALNLEFTNTEVLHVPLRNIHPTVLRPLVQAAREQKRVEISYISLTSPVAETRVITPHTLVCTSLRWHVRAYCEKNRGYRDFVLSRFRDRPEIIGDSPNAKAEDDLWNTEVIIRLAPDTRLSPVQQEIIAHDYGMVDGTLDVPTRASQVVYVLQAFDIDPYKQSVKPEAQQLVIENYREIESYLY